MSDVLTPAVRVPVGEWPRHLLPGEYCGPIYGYTDNKPAVFFNPPGSDSWPHNERAARHVVSPPHIFRECADGSLEIRESLGCFAIDSTPEKPRFIWHGYLDEGNMWRQVGV